MFIQGAASLILIFFSSSVFAWSEISDDEWTTGWGQGMVEAQVTNGSGNRIYVACEDIGSGNGAIHFELSGSGPKNNIITVSFDNNKKVKVHSEHRGIIKSKNSDFTFLIESLRNSSSIYVSFSDGRESAFTLKGSSEALSSCTGFSQIVEEPIMVDNPDVIVSLRTNPYYGTLVFKVQAIEDEVFLKHVVVNRGNCELAPGTLLEIKNTVKLGFGQSYEGYAGCAVDDVLEIVVDTKKGTSVFSF